MIQEEELKQIFINKTTLEKRELKLIFSIIFLKRDNQSFITLAHNHIYKRLKLVAYIKAYKTGLGYMV